MTLSMQRVVNSFYPRTFELSLLKACLPEDSVRAHDFIR